MIKKFYVLPETIHFCVRGLERSAIYNRIPKVMQNALRR